MFLWVQVDDQHSPFLMPPYQCCRQALYGGGLPYPALVVHYGQHFLQSCFVAHISCFLFYNFVAKIAFSLVSTKTFMFYLLFWSLFLLFFCSFAYFFIQILVFFLTSLSLYFLFALSHYFFIYLFLYFLTALFLYFLISL